MAAALALATTDTIKRRANVSLTRTTAVGIAVPRGLLFTVPIEGPAGLQGFVKRTLDIILATLLLCVCGLPMLLIAVLIKLDSSGPAIIRQNRVGRGRRSFRMYKFRSMVVDAESLQAGLLEFNEQDGPIFKIRDDPRRTRSGRYLRRLSLDELPQLVNVVLGDMSLVGPRPPLDHEVAQDYLRQSRRLQFPPGMTGLWQVSGRSELAYEEMVRLDLSYAHNWSILTDLWILARTLPVVIIGKGAY